MKRLLGSFGVLSLFFCGCFAHVQPLPKVNPGYPVFAPLADQSQTLLGIAFGGGGKRAAYFAASGMEALAHLKSNGAAASVLEQVTHLTSSSGGSIAASYFAVHKPSSSVRMLDTDGSLSSVYQDFFDSYRSAMATNYETGMYWRQLLKVRWLNSNQRATSMAEVLDAAFLKGQTFQTLYEREKKGDSPRLILNATLFNNGRQFALSTLPGTAFDYNIIAKIQNELEAKSPRSLPLPQSLYRSSIALNPLTFEDYGTDSRQVPLALAVAASMSFPFFLGPVTIQTQGSDSYFHIGDGGLFDAQATDTLAHLFLKSLEDGRASRALIIAFDSSFPFWTKFHVLDKMENGFDIFVKDPGRIVGIVQQRANAYESLNWHMLQSQAIVIPDSSTIKILVLRHTDDVWPNDWVKAIPEACRTERFDRREDILERLAVITTRYRLPSECDKALLKEAAVRGVESRKREILDFLSGRR